MLSRRSFFILLYLCVAFFLIIFFISFFSQALGSWVGGDGFFDDFKGGFYRSLKAGLAGFCIGFIYWFFYYRRV